jgi:serine/threonine protein kinase/DNA-binding SARP family transcriptional activator
MIRIDTLGSTRVFVDESESPTLLSQPLRCALLIYMAVERKSWREKILGVFWPEQDERGARHALSQNLYELRKLLGEDWLKAQGEELTVTENVALDVHLFTQAVEREDYAAALKLYRGPFLRAGPLVNTRPFEEWVDQRVFKLRRAWIHAGQAHVERLTQAGETARAVRAAREVVEVEPQEDQLQHLLIDLLGRSGLRTEAIEQYALYERALREDDLEPLDETKELVARIRGDSRAERTVAHAVVTSRETHAHGPAEIESWDRLEARLKAELAPGFEIIRLLGHGEVASVFLAREPALRRLVALKILAPAVARDPTARLRFEREGQAIANIMQPNVVAVFRVDRLRDDLPYLVIQYVKGRTLADLLHAEGPLELADARRIIADLAAALAATHKTGIVHRDVKPANVIVEEDSGRAVLTDFGTAAVMERGDERSLQLTRTGEVIGDPSYMSPEQRTGRSLTELADVYSLGVLAYEILTGRKPLMHANAEPPRISELRPGVDTTLENVLQRCLSSNPAHRPSATDLLRQLNTPLAPAKATVAAATAESRADATQHASESSSGAVATEPPSGLSWLLAELKRRRVYRVTIAYTVASVAVVEVANNFFPALGLPALANTLVAALAVLGLPVVIALAWAFDITPRGVVRTKDRT